MLHDRLHRARVLKNMTLQQVADQLGGHYQAGSV